MKWGLFKQLVEGNGVHDDMEIDFIDASLLNDEPVLVMTGAMGIKIMTNVFEAGKELDAEGTEKGDPTDV